MFHKRAARRSILLAIAAGLTLAALPGAVSAANEPVILVHGWRGDPGTWADMKAYLEANNRTVYAIDLPGEDNIANAAAILELIAAESLGVVDIVGQSMGGLSSRYLVKSGGGGSVVDDYVSIGTPQYGIWTACLLATDSGGQMCPTSSFLRKLNRGDDTPNRSGRLWTTIYSTSDEIVPNSSSRLDGTACFVQVSGPRHNEMDNDSAVMAAVLDGIDGTCAGTVK
jgi:triacylglycerol lipase